MKSKSTQRNIIKGYKVADSEGRCRGHLFEVGKTYKHKGVISMCNSGFHFCLNAAHCFSYYDFHPKNKVFEVEGIGEHQTHEQDSKICVGEIKIVRQLTWDEVLQVANSGSGNSGHSNSGDRNSGDRNSGNRNSGDRNSGYRNSGNRNSGNRNSGNRNSGDLNSGNLNSCHLNSGNRNSGYLNSGDRNSGDLNSGNRNSGYLNSGNRNSGLFCTGDAPFLIFNKPSKWTEDDFLNSEAGRLRWSIETKLFIPSSQMTPEEKTSHPYHETTEGYVKNIPFKEAFQNAWHNWDANSRKAFTSLPNFDPAIFFEITGVKVKQ